MMAVSHSKSSIASKLGRPATILAAFFASSHSYIMTILYIQLEGLSKRFSREPSTARRLLGCREGVRVRGYLGRTKVTASHSVRISGTAKR